MPTDYDTIGNDLTQTTQFDPTTYGLESDDSTNNSLGITQHNSDNYTNSNNSQSDPIIGTEAIAGTQDGLMLESGESGTQLSDLTGAYSVGTTNYEWVDPMRDETYTEDPTDKRELTVKVWYPSEKVTEGKTAAYIDNEEVLAAITKDVEQSNGIPAEQSINLVNSIKTNSISEAPVAQTESEYPVLVFSPGLGNIPEEYTAQAEHLASQGYVVVGINHAYDAAATGFSDGRIVQTSPKFDAISDDFNPQVINEIINEDLDIRAADAQFVLDQPFYENLPNDAYNLTIKGSTHSSFSDVPLLENLIDSEAPSDIANSDSITLIDPVRGTTIINDYTAIAYRINGCFTIMRSHSFCHAFNSVI